MKLCLKYYWFVFFPDTVYISALRGCCALKFLHALDIDQGYLAHPPTGVGFPPPPKKKMGGQ